MQVKEEVFPDAGAVQCGQAHNERVGEVLAHPALQLQTVFAVGGQSFGVLRGAVLIDAAAVCQHGNAGNQDKSFGRDLADILPRGAHDGKVGLRVGVGQEHGRRHARVDTEVRAGAVLRGYVTAVACRGEGMFGQQIAPHKPGGADEQVTGHSNSPLHIYTRYIIAYYGGKSNALCGIAQGVSYKAFPPWGKVAPQGRMRGRFAIIAR